MPLFLTHLLRLKTKASVNSIAGSKDQAARNPPAPSRKDLTKEKKRDIGCHLVFCNDPEQRSANGLRATTSYRVEDDPVFEFVIYMPFRFRSRITRIIKMSESSRSVISYRKIPAVPERVS